MKKQIILSLIVITTIGLSQTINAQTIHDNIAEDQVIICINGTVIEQSGNICKVFMADLDHDRNISDLQQELYDNPNSDTFNMDVRD